MTAQYVVFSALNNITILGAWSHMITHFFTI